MFASSRARSAGSASDVISICIQDSRVPAAPGSRMPQSRPSGPRATVRIGWMIRWTTRLLALIAAVTELTRNGMSSLTISTIVCGDDQPSAAGSGLCTRILAWPGRRRSAKAPQRQGGAVEIAGRAFGDIRRRNVLVKLRNEPIGGRLICRVEQLTGERRRLVDERRLLGFDSAHHRPFDPSRLAEC